MQYTGKLINVITVTCCLRRQRPSLGVVNAFHFSLKTSKSSKIKSAFLTTLQSFVFFDAQQRAVNGAFKSVPHVPLRGEERFGEEGEMAEKNREKGEIT